MKHPKKGLINIKNKDNKYFLWCHVKHLNLVNKNAERISKKDKELYNTLDYSNINFSVSKKDYCKIEVKNSICINVYSCEDDIIYPSYVSKEKFSDSMDLLLIHDNNKSHCVYIKDFNRFMFNTSKTKNKNYSCRYCLLYFNSENILTEYKENCLVITGRQYVKLNKRFISFKNYSRQIPVPFKIYADFECILKKY